MIVKIAKHKFLKPHFCPDCGKLVLIVRHPKSVHCNKCHKKNNRKNNKINRKARLKHHYHGNYGWTKRVGFCALCGSREHLTAHHVGGGAYALTCLCDECHQAYEFWNQCGRPVHRKKKGFFR